MTLPTDQYYIRSGSQYVARSRHEDLSLNPKAIFADDNVDLWFIEALDNGRYRLRARGAPVAELGGLLYAILIGQGDKNTEWVITRQGPNDLYTIAKPSGERWVRADEEESQIAVRYDSSDNTIFKIQALVE